ENKDDVEMTGFDGSACLKCGGVVDGHKVFDEMTERDVVSWNSVVYGNVKMGWMNKARELSDEMPEKSIVSWTAMISGLLLVLPACAQSGALKLGKWIHFYVEKNVFMLKTSRCDFMEYFDSMKNDYNLEPGMEHYGCLVDLLGRTGCLDQAFELIKTMPMKPDSVIWGSLLSSCGAKGNLELAVIAMEHLLELKPEDTGNYVLLSNIYADLGRWDGVSRVRKFLRGKIMAKTPRCNSIEVDNVVEEFMSGDDSKPFIKEVYRMLELQALHHKISR
ncbi:pentatricopeptide repeat-containing protein, partial [Tanacetum coccineum]